MSASREDLIARFADVSDEVLLTRLHAGELTDEARGIAQRELSSRGVDYRPKYTPGERDDGPGRGEPFAPATHAADGNDLVMLVGHLMPVEADILKTRLEAEGIAATVADAHLGQVGWALPAAGGGARVLVAERDLDDARNVLTALQSGKYRLDDEEGEARACPKCGGTDLTPFVPGFLASVFKYSGPAERLRCAACGHTWPNTTSSL
jgi:hypothetical protein